MGQAANPAFQRVSPASSAGGGSGKGKSKGKGVDPHATVQRPVLNWNPTEEPFPSTAFRAPATQLSPHHPWTEASSFGEETVVPPLSIDDDGLHWWRPKDISADRWEIRSTGGRYIDSVVRNGRGQLCVGTVDGRGAIDWGRDVPLP